MREFVTDAHPLVWHLTKDAHLSPRCQRIFAQADAGRGGDDAAPVPIERVNPSYRQNGAASVEVIPAFLIATGSALILRGVAIKPKRVTIGTAMNTEEKRNFIRQKARQCSSCHEPYTTGEVTDRIIGLLNSLHGLQAEVLILPYPELQPASAFVPVAEAQARPMAQHTK